MTRLIISISISCCLLAACKNEEKKTLSQITGKWEVAEVFRNSKFTTTLEGGVFEFSESKKLTTNIYGESLVQDFIISGNIISVKSDPKADYKILRCDDTSMTLGSQIEGNDFEFVLKKVIN